MKLPIIRAMVFAVSLVCPVAAGWAGTLEQDFKTPPREATPWVYWMWLRTPTTPQAMTRDLEEMKAKGITGFILYDNGAGNMGSMTKKMVPGDKAFKEVSTGDFKGSHTILLPVLATWSPEWRREIRFVAQESKRLNLDFCLCIGLAGCSAPGLDPQYAEQRLVWSSQDVTGPQTFSGALPIPAQQKEQKEKKSHGSFAEAYRDVMILAVPIKDHVDLSEVQDISAKMDASGHLNWNVPSGNWRILRFGQMPIGITNPWGLFCDHLSTEAFDQDWALTMAPLLKEMTPGEQSAMKYVEDDSWEAGNPTWTKSFPEEFLKRRGYGLSSYLPILAGQTIADRATTAKFKRDYALTISDLELNNYYRHMNTVCNANGLTLYSETNGPNYNGIDVTQSGFQVDHNMGEFWMPSPHRATPATRFLTRDAVTSNHLKGDLITMCESFTSISPNWSESPFSLKACADQAFCDGVNRNCIHNYSHSPLLDDKPGDIYFAGTLINRNLTWWDEAPAFFGYLSRCCALLQKGSFVADALFYIGDGIDRAAPRKMVYPTLGPGYDYDRADATSLINLAGVKDGRIVLSTGMTYRLLILPDATPMSSAGLKKISSLVEAGATVVGARPTGLAGISLKPEEEAAFNTLVTHLWGNDPTNTTGLAVGLGHVYENKTAHDVLAAQGIPPDFESEGVSSAGEIDWIHRSTGDAEIYYVTSRWFSPENLTCKFRVTGKQPELWDPVIGEMREAKAFHQENGQTIIPISFDPCGSTFVVFRKPIAATAAGTAKSNYPDLKTFGALSGSWMVTFDSKWGGPEQPVIFDHLTDWTQRSEPGIKYFSGTATYSKKFDLPARPPAGQRILLDLGDVREVASVRLNGNDLGVVWTKPARVDITSALKNADNELEIKVTNLWPNRLIGDSMLPLEQQLTKTNIHNYSQATPLLQSGLLGPVSLIAAKTGE